ncbi:DUF4249 domain-containing protein [Spirosoma aerolatum]|uniref:DUF4249 domain-containing protein n=1 Tax=Spirosoma aerolatum TaxID=1211326 RepID=UPI0009AD449E|nr:DUF4249 domain-containing protein [Spirosoma aerolatum]
MKLNLLIYLVFASLFAACTSLRQEVNPVGLEQDSEKLVVACFISPQDTVLAARVTHSLPILGTTNDLYSDIPNATVTLSDGNRTILLKSKQTANAFGNTSLSYSAAATELPIVVGKTYTLTVQVPDGRKVIGTCTVPNAIPLTQMTLDSGITTEYGDRRKSYYARLQWRDPAGQANFYRVAGNNEYKQRFPVLNSSNNYVRDTLMSFRGDWYFENGSTITDIGRDGQEIVSVRGRLSPFSYTLMNGIWVGVPPSGRIDGYLLNLDENYYRYHDAVERQNKVRDNPFAEPVLIPTNIQGGLGCFGAYNRSTLTIMVK